MLYFYASNCLNYTHYITIGAFNVRKAVSHMVYYILCMICNAGGKCCFTQVYINFTL